MITASANGHFFSKKFNPVFNELPIPFSQKGLMTASAEDPDTILLWAFSLAPNTTTVFLADDLAAASIDNLSKVFPFTSKSCFDWPIRDDEPAARMIMPMFALAFSKFNPAG